MTRAESSCFTLPGRISEALAARPEGVITFISGEENAGNRL